MTPSQTIICEEICRLLSLGRSLSEICRESWAPAKATFLDWCAADAGLADRYARAKDDGLEVLFDELEDLSEQSKRAETKGEIAGWRNIIDTRKWRLSKMHRRYSDKVTAEVTGANGGPLVAVAVSVAAQDPVEASATYKAIMDGTAS